MPTNITNFTGRLAQHRKLIEQAALKGVFLFANQVITNAKTITPVDTGKLISSGGTDTPKINGNSVTIVLGFGAKYAAAVHENLNANFKVGQAKFLEVPMRRMQPQFAPFMAEQIQSVVGSR